MVDRRRFIQSLSAAAVAGSVGPTMKALLVPNPSTQVRSNPRVAVLLQPGFPTVDAQPIDTSVLERALTDMDSTVLRVDQLDRVTPDDFDVYLNPYGSAFPKQAWGQLLQFLAAGGNWVNLGGVPFAVPVVRDGDDWRTEVRQTAYHKRLGVTQAFGIDTSRLARHESNRRITWTRALVGNVETDATYELYYRFTRVKEYPDEDGSDGPREAVVEPLLSLYGSGEHPVAAPVVRVDRLLGPYAGGRWILGNFDGTITAEAIRATVRDAALGANRLAVSPSYACYREDESPEISVTLRSPGNTSRKAARCRLRVFDDHDLEIAATTIGLDGTGFAVTASTSLQTVASTALPPGLYRIEAQLESDDSALDGTIATSGFWMHDPELLAAGSPFTTDEYTLLRDGQPYVVTGTSYMATDVHRRFLLEANAHVFDRDFAAMRRAGINMIRTGIWTGWRNYMSEDGELNEAALRGLDAFLLTARRHDIPVIFTFFAFIPEDWGGANPYLDPRAVAAQKRFISGIVSRYSEMNDVIWDLINEPSCCSPDRLWVTRPNYDEYETHAWESWLRERFPSESPVELDSKLSELWRTLPGEALDLPSLDEFGDRNIFEDLRPLKAMEYRLFANNVFARWTREMVETIHRAGSPTQLVTVGQDEGGTYERASPTFYGPEVAFTSNHTWWLNDDLLWDSIVTKTPERPNLISETGIMFYEKIDGSAWRSEGEARDLLERKLAIASVVGGAGWIEWIWNTNPYMPLDNESAIGLLRPDGTAKPEFAVLRDMARFVAEALPQLGPRELDSVVMVTPHSHMFSVRNFATGSTQRCVRAMCYGCRMPMSAVSEYTLDRLSHRPSLIVVPSPRILTEKAWRQLVNLAEDGTTVLITGPIDFDEHWRPAPRLEVYGIRTKTAAVANEENLDIAGKAVRLTFSDLKIQRVEKAVVEGDAPHIRAVSLGRGRLIWSPLPVELADQVDPTVTLYRYALGQVDTHPRFTLEPDDPGLLVYPAVHQSAVLYAIASELAVPRRLTLTDRVWGTHANVEVPAGGAVLQLMGNRGKLGSYQRG